MFVKKLKDCRQFIAGDGSILCELLHGVKMNLQIDYSLALAKVPAGQKSRPHRLSSCEVYYILAGKGTMHINDESI